jgi:hypothetical protein
MKEDLAAVLGKVLTVCEKQGYLDKKLIIVESRCENHKNFPEQLRVLTESTIKMRKDIDVLAASQLETGKLVIQLNDKSRFADFTWKVVWGNSVFKTSILGIFLSVVGVYWGRVGQ